MNEKAPNDSTRRNELRKLIAASNRDFAVSTGLTEERIKEIRAHIAAGETGKVSKVELAKVRGATEEEYRATENRMQGLVAKTLNPFSGFYLEHSNQGIESSPIVEDPLLRSTDSFTMEGLEVNREQVELLSAMAETISKQYDLARLDSATTAQRFETESKSAKKTNVWVIAGTWIASLTGIAALLNSIFDWF